MTARKILLSVGEDESRATAQATYVTELFDPADVSVVIHHDFEDNPEGAHISQVASVRRARERLTAAGFTVTLSETSGDPAARVLDVASDLDVSLICIGGRRRSPTGKAVFGSTTQTVVLDADRPVLVIPERASKQK